MAIVRYPYSDANVTIAESTAQPRQVWINAPKEIVVYTGADMTPAPEVVVQLLQLKIALHNAGLLAAAQTVVNGASQQRQLQWQIQSTIRRGELVSNLLRTALSQTPAQWDAIFAAAAAIDPTS